MNKIYSHLLYIGKLRGSKEIGNPAVAPLLSSLEGRRFKLLMGELERLMPAIPDDSVRQIAERLSRA